MLDVYPDKVQTLLNWLTQPPEFGGKPWEAIAVDVRPDGNSITYIIRAQKYPGGNAFVNQNLSLYVHVTKPKSDREWYERERTGVRFAGGYLRRFGGDVRIKTWREARRECRS